MAPDFAFVYFKNDESKTAILMNTTTEDYTILQVHTQENKN